MAMRAGFSGTGRPRAVAGKYQTFQADAGENNDPPVRLDRTIVSCVRLQTLMYFTFWYDLLLASILAGVGLYKYSWLQGDVVWAVFSANIFVCFFVEPFRLYVGHCGNLEEGVTFLFLFVFVSFSVLAAVAAQLGLYRFTNVFMPSACSSRADKKCVMPLELAALLVKLVFLVAEFILGVRALTRLIREESARFFVSLQAADAGDGDDGGHRHEAGSLAPGRSRRGGSRPSPMTYGRGASSLREHAE